MRLLKKHIKVKEKSHGRKFWQEKKHLNMTGNWLPDETLEAFKDMLWG